MITEQQPDPENPFRKWLASKDAAYQVKVNDTRTASVMSRAIRLFQSESIEKPRTTQSQVRSERIKEAVQPKGDGGHPTSRNNDEDDFASGYLAVNRPSSQR